MSKVLNFTLFFAALGLSLLPPQLCAAPANCAAAAQAYTAQDPEGITGDEAADADSQPASAFRTTVRHLFNEEKFSELDEIAGDARSQKSRFLGGTWKLHALYTVLQGPGSLTATDSAWNAHFDRLQRWMASKPDSITPRVALAKAYLRFAWKARDNGGSDKVTPDAWKLFGERVQKSGDTLEQAKSLSTRAPEWYRTTQTIALAQSEQLFAEATGAEPDYQ